MTSSMATSLLRQLENLGEDAKDIVADTGLRRKLYEATQKLSLALETPGDTIQRIAYTPLQLTAAKIAGDLNLFETLTKVNSAISVNALAKEVKVEPLFLGRLLRYCASVGMIKETGEDEYAANEITRTLAKPALKAGVNHQHLSVVPCYQSLPKFLKDTNYANPTDPTHCAFQRAHQTDQVPFVWMMSHPEEFDNFNQWMTGAHEGQKTWLEVYPVQQELLKDAAAETPVFVDIGGGIGHQCVNLKSSFPEAPGRVFLQDLPQVIEQSIPHDGVEKMPHDFMTPQPVKGARAYYMRNILHDYPDEKCIRILHHIMAAMDQNSVILIDEMVMPNRDPSWKATQVDWTMMAALAAMERSEKQWYALMEQAGLKIQNIYRYTEDVQDSIIVAVPK